MNITTLEQFEAYLKTRIPTRDALFMGDIGLKRAAYFMRLLGNPQNNIKVIHIAGTSGKGSTATFMSRLLESQGFKVGLQVSPHVLDVRERLQIDNTLPDEKLVLEYFHQIFPVIKKMETSRYGGPTYFEILVGLAFVMFAKEKCDYAVIETGLGGMLDATNTISKPKLSIITKIGLDHTQILGNTLTKIAEQKAAIIGKQNTVVSIQQSQNVLSVIKEQCEITVSELYIVGKKNYKIKNSGIEGSVFDFNFPRHPEFISGSQKQILKQVQNDNIIHNIHLKTIGRYQVENCTVALAALRKLAARDAFKIHEEKIKRTLSTIHIPGRLELRKTQHIPVILDGAHNPQKMSALCNDLKKLFPNKKFTFIVAFKKTKDYPKMLAKILPIADKIFLTHFSLDTHDNYLSSVDTSEIKTYLQKVDFKKFKVIGNKKSDFLKVFRSSKNPVIVTGSLYLISIIK